MTARARSLRAALVALVASATAFACLRPITESDAFWHLALGESVLAHHARTVPEPFAFASFGRAAVVPEWLWGVLAWALHRAGSWRAAAALPPVLAAATALATFGMLRAAEARPREREEGDARFCSRIFVTALVAATTAYQTTLRPQAAFHALLPTFLLVAHRYAAAEGRRAARLGAGLVALTVLWAQLHGSFVLAPALFALVAFLPVAPPPGRERARGAAILAALVVALASGAHGLDVVGYVAGHASGDATRHIQDMSATTWELLNPGASLASACCLVLWTAGALGMAREERLFAREVALALLGVALLATAPRFFPAAAILGAPLGHRGLGALAPRAPRLRALAPWAAFAGSALALARTTADLRGLAGPARLGLEEGQFPALAASFLARLPAGSNVLTSYEAGAPLGLWLHGAARTYVDSRTPLHFDDAEFAVARDVFRTGAALARAARLHDARAIVVARGKPACASPPAGWVAAVVEPRFTTFVPEGESPPLGALAPCGARFLADDACREGGAVLDRDIARLAELGDTAFVRYLRAERVARCGGEVEAALALVPPEGEAWPYRAQRALTLGSLHLRRGDAAAALDAVERLARQGDADALALLEPALEADRIPVERARSMLEAAALALDDAAPAKLRALLALACAAQGDARCARFNAKRAAVGGSRSALGALVWVAEHDPSPAARAEAVALADLLRAERGPK